MKLTSHVQKLHFVHFSDQYCVHICVCQGLILSTFHHGCCPCWLEGPRVRGIPTVILKRLLHDLPPQQGPTGPPPPNKGNFLMDLQASLLFQLLQMGTSQSITKIVLEVYLAIHRFLQQNKNKRCATKSVVTLV